MAQRATRGAFANSIGIIFVAIVATLSVVLPIIVGIIASEVYSKQLESQDFGIQLTVLTIGLIILVLIEILTLIRTVRIRR